MPRKVPIDEQQMAIEMMLETNRSGQYIYGQREIERETGLSRPFIRKLAREIGHQFPRNGIEVLGRICACENCGGFFRRPPSKVDRASLNFCDELCKSDYMRGDKATNWKDGSSSNSFSKWAVNQKEYKEFKQAVLEKYNHQCIVTGDTDVDVHHIAMKSTNPELAFSPENGVPLSKWAHIEIHKLMKKGVEFEDAITKLKEIYVSKKKEAT